ncbi:unnamed protein product [Malus baccata var. baccata]
MDSGNSGSMQSSSGGDDEYDSRAESISAVLSNPPSQLGPMSNPPPHHHHHHQEMDPLSNMFDPLSSRLTNPNPLLNFDMMWSKTLRSDPNPTDLAGLSQPLLTSPCINQLGQSRGGAAAAGGGGVSSTFAALQIPQDNQNVSASFSAPNNQTHNNGVVRNPKKRSRASRRAPTTVLTTDTTNFRAMVQEFTGIPAPPFSSSSPFARSRLDLFGSAAAASSLMRSAGGGGGGGGLGLDAPPPYLLRPFAQKVTHQPSSSLLDPINSPSTNHNLLNVQNQNPSSSSSSSSQVLNFQSLFQSQQQSPKYPLMSVTSPPHHHQAGSLGGPPHQHFGLTHQQQQQVNVNALSNNIVSSSNAALSRHDTSNGPSWGTDRTGSNKNSDNSNNIVDHQRLMSSINGNYGNGKLNYSAAGPLSNIVLHAGSVPSSTTAAAATTTPRSEVIGGEIRGIVSRRNLFHTNQISFIDFAGIFKGTGGAGNILCESSLMVEVEAMRAALLACVEKGFGIVQLETYLKVMVDMLNGVLQLDAVIEGGIFCRACGRLSYVSL